MTLDIKQEAESFFDGKPVMVYRDDAADFAQHCVDKATAWRPIADAPKDGTVVLVFWSIYKPEALASGFVNPIDAYGVVYWDAELNSWVEADGSDVIEPTHFQHLPQPPEAA